MGKFTTQKVWLDLGKARTLDELDHTALPGLKASRRVLETGELEASVRQQTDALRDELIALQERLYAERKQSLLIVLQAMDTAGKDGVISKVFSGVNPQGVRVAHFEKPSSLELSHDYLWRAHAAAPKRGEICIFNRSHYEDVLVVRVQKLVPKAVWKRRYRHITEFERMLNDEGTQIVKLCLMISKDEQRARLQARIDDAEKVWKFDPNDLVQREKWADYMVAYADAIRETDRGFAPWHIIPANFKWFRDWAVMRILVQRLRDMSPQLPKPSVDAASVVIV
jgi:PPK2 family polyphosphate:nucleotide phosphotransferase